MGPLAWFCPDCYQELSDRQKQRARERQKQMDLAKKRGQHHMGPQIQEARI